MMKWIFPFILGLRFLNGQETSLFITEDYQKATRLAYEYSMPMALIFTGSDWSKASQDFLRDCLFCKDQMNWLCHDLVFVWIDFPELNTRPSHLIEQNYYLREKLQATYFPMVVLLDSQEAEITRFACSSREEFVLLIKERLLTYEYLKGKWREGQITKNEKFIISCYETAQKLGSKQFINEMIQFAVEHQICPLLIFEYYTILANKKNIDRSEIKKLRRLLLQLDPKNEKGIYEQVALFDYQQWQNVLPIEVMLKQFRPHKSENFWWIHLFLSECLLGMEKVEKALEHAQTSYWCAPLQKRESISSFIDEVSMMKCGGYP